MLTFQKFTDSIINALETRNPDVMKLTMQGVLENIYSGLPLFHEQSEFQSWIQDATLKHPLRREDRQHLWLYAVQLQEDGDQLALTTKLLCAVAELQDWKEHAYDPENLIKDPEMLYFLKQKNGLEDVDKDTAGANDDYCLICANSFDNTYYIPQRAPCGHVLCSTCFGKWLLEAKGVFTCPLCRACVVCGENDCKYHVVYQDQACPIPLPLLLKKTLRSRADMVLCGIPPERYWWLREDTRHDRGTMAYIKAMLETYSPQSDEPSRAWLARASDEAWAEVRGRIARATSEMMIKMPIETT